MLQAEKEATQSVRALRHGQQAFGRRLLEEHVFVAIASAVSEESWNLIFNPKVAAGRYRLDTQKVLALDTRLNPPV